ncbi:PstC family ABC transporter permease, partial [Megasphaera sp.]|uniref:PstC family ABC transporter permease n=1 Tax=Megasphaera sp. TaxID=2023260 RepID=UPI004029C0C5
MNAIETVVQRAHRNEKAAKTFITICGIGMALVPLLIGAFLFIKGTDTFFTFGHSVTEFLFSGQWKPSDTAEGGGQVGAAMFLAGSLVTCLLSLIISLPFSLASSIYMTEIATPQRRRFIQPAIELFTGIPSVVYGFVGMTVLIPALRHIFPIPIGFSVIADGIVLAIIIYPLSLIN